MTTETNITEWYYADAQSQQQGPLDATSLATAYRAGRVRADSLVWRDGLDGWVPLARVAGELGVVVSPPPPPSTAPRSEPGGRRIPGIAARAPAPGSASSRRAAWIIVAATLAFGAVCVLAILAAIALPAYRQFTLRAQVAQAALAGTALQAAVDDWSESTGTCPRNGDGDIGSAASYANAHVRSIEVAPVEDADGECGIRLTLASAQRQLAGKVLQWTRDAEGDWHVATDLDHRYLPVSLRAALD